MRKPAPPLALVHPHALQPVEEVLGEAVGPFGAILQDEHADAPGLPITVGKQMDRLGLRRGLAHRLDDRPQLDVRAVPEERERDVQVLARDDAPLPELPGLPLGQRVEHGIGQPQRAEEP